MAIWSQKKWLVIFLVHVILGHWSLLLHGKYMHFPSIYKLTLAGILLTAIWLSGQDCIIVSTHILAISFIYSIVFDFTILRLTAYKLLSPQTSRSYLVGLIFGDGLIYFLIV